MGDQKGSLSGDSRGKMSGDQWRRVSSGETGTNNPLIEELEVIRYALWRVSVSPFWKNLLDQGRGLPQTRQRKTTVGVHLIALNDGNAKTPWFCVNRGVAFLFGKGVNANAGTRLVSYGSAEAGTLMLSQPEKWHAHAWCPHRYPK